MFNHARILIVRLSSIGDVLHATTVARNLKQSYPLCHITWIVSRTAADLLRFNPDIDELFVWSREDFELAMKQHRWRAAWQSVNLLRRFYACHAFDLVLDIHGLFLSGAVAWLSRVPRRIGMANTRELNWLFMTEQAPGVASPHMIQRYLSVLEPLLAATSDYRLRLVLPPEIAAFADRFLAEKKIRRSQPLLMVTPWTSWSNKNWGVENFAACLNLLPAEVQILLCGGSSDQQNNQKIADRLDRAPIDITGQTNLLELAGLIQACDLLLTGDTGALHIATALNVPTLSLWGPTRPEKYGPLVPGHCFICSEHGCTNCDKTKCRYQTNACMNAIVPAFVSQKILQLLSTDKEKASRLKA